MSDADVISFRVEVELSATISIKTGDQSFNYVKPGVSAAITWNDVPTGEQLADAVQLLQEGTTQPILDEIIQVSNQKLQELNR